MFGSNSYEHTAYRKHALTLAAADYAVPHPTTFDSLGTRVTNALQADALELRAPTSNAGAIYVSLDATATTASLIIRNGDRVDVSGANKKTLSALADNAGDELEIIAKYK